ncbi:MULTISPECIES: hypothetical protein [Pantoea]|uniref:Uncharacterized protein n=1 Tax=Candidatus Pantoea multigeneris TaxID=2608357 RepID=A0ABX0RGP9_9GAMM|nr:MULTISPECIES: hypothetical protein [Pantoea]NIF23974.1 hypothetical protein [Pantoea multigeneris]
MILSEFMLKVSRWPDMHFTAIESEQREAGIEIYALDEKPAADLPHAGCAACVGHDDAFPLLT